MSTNNNFKKNKCWSCEFFCGHRQYKNGFFFGDFVETDSKGICSNNRSSNNGKSIYEDNWCSKYQKWGVLLSAIAREEEKKRLAQQQKQQTQSYSDYSQNEDSNLSYNEIKSYSRKEVSNLNNNEIQEQREKAFKLKLKRIIIIFSILIIILTILFCTIPFIVENIIKNDENNVQEPEIDLSEYDYVVGKDYSDLVKVTFIIANIEGRIGETWKVWGVPRNERLNSYEPIYPEKYFDYAQYGLTPDFSYLKGENIFIDSYLFQKDTIVYCKYYGGDSVASPSLKINIVKEKSHIISGEVASVSMRINTEVYELPSLANKFAFLTDLGEYRMKPYEYSAFYDLIEYSGYTKFTWFYDENLTQKISVPYKILETDKIVYWVLAEK